MEDSKKLSKVGIDLLTDPEMKNVKDRGEGFECILTCGFDEDGEPIQIAFYSDQCDKGCGASYYAIACIYGENNNIIYNYCPNY